MDNVRVNYRENHKIFRDLVFRASKFSVKTIDMRARTKRTEREEVGFHVFGKICATGISICKLLPKSPLENDNSTPDLWDISSVCALSRSLIDAYNIFYYITVDRVSKQETDCRFTIWDLHSSSERLEMLNLIKDKNPDIKGIETNIKNLKAKLDNDPYFQSLNLKPKEKKRFLNGKKGILLANTDISKRAGIHPDFYRAAYKFLSNHVHTSPFSVSQYAVFRAGNDKELRLFNSVLYYGIGYLCLAVRDFIKIVPQLASELPNEQVKLIAEWETRMSTFFLRDMA